MLVTMAKIEMIGPKTFFNEAIALLQQLGTLHIEDLSKNKDELPVRAMEMDFEALDSRNNLRNLLTRLNGVISVLGPFTSERDLSKKEDKGLWEQDNSYLTKEAESLLAALEEKTRELANKKSKLQLELSSLSKYEQVLKKVYPLVRKVMPLEDSETVAFLLEGDYKDSVTAINDEIDKLTEGNFELISTAIDDTTTAAIIVFSKKYSAKVHSFLNTQTNEINVPSDVKDLSVDKVLAEIAKKRESYPLEIEKCDRDLKPLTSDFGRLRSISNAIANRIEQIESMTSFAQTDYTFVLHAWLPQKELGALNKAIDEKWEQKIVTRQLELNYQDYEEAPVSIENPTWAKPYEFFTSIFQLPKYGTLDPTIFLAIFFPLFFGFIVGDVGYGLIVLITATALNIKFKDNIAAAMATRMFQVASVSTIIFGMFYGEAFGNLAEEVFPQYFEKPWFHIGSVPVPYLREATTERLMELLYVSLGIGFVHLTISLVMGIVNARREHAYKHMWERVGMLGFMTSLVTMGVSALLRGSFGLNPEIILAIVGSIASIGLIVVNGGVIGTIEGILGTVENLASYLRLMALGFAGVVLAGVANDFGKASAAGIVMALLLHIINVVVHTISPAMHSLRLNLLEGFGKFYEEGGREYKPFMARR